MNTSIYCFRRDLLAPALRRLSPENSQGEYYLTDVVSVLHDAGYPVGSYVIADAVEVQGVNDRVQLAQAEAELRARTNRDWLAAGVTMVDPAQTYVDVTVDLSPDVTLFPGTILQGVTTIGPGAEIGPSTRLVDTKVGPGAVVANTVARNAVIGADCVVGPFAALDPGAELASGYPNGCLLHCSSERRILIRGTSGAGGSMELVTKKRFVLYSGRAHLALAEEIAEHLGRRARQSERAGLRERRDAPSVRRVGAGLRRVHHADARRHVRDVDQRRDHGAADHDRRCPPRLGQAHHRGVPVLRIRASGSQGRGPRADHRQARRRPVQGRRREADDLGRSALRSDPRLLRRPGRPSHWLRRCSSTTCRATRATTR